MNKLNAQRRNTGSPGLLLGPIRWVVPTWVALLLVGCNADEQLNSPSQAVVTIAAMTPFYNGCYMNTPYWNLPVFADSRSDMTNPVCQALCFGYPYAGTQSGSDCYCGYAVNGGYLAPDTECNAPCSGDSSQMCGGTLRYSVYHVPEYLGCYSDDTANRALPVFMGSSTDMTSAKCGSLCVGYNVAGLQHGDQCWCGNQTRYQPRPDSECNVPCSGDPSQTCGGCLRNSIYMLGDPCYGCWDY